MGPALAYFIVYSCSLGAVTIAAVLVRLQENLAAIVLSRNITGTRSEKQSDTEKGRLCCTTNLLHKASALATFRSIEAHFPLGVVRIAWLAFRTSLHHRMHECGWVFQRA